tara:strand:- start:854 stop:1585 length:732 start_codon:yes stop_codon:yes gene_type:complete
MKQNNSLALILAAGNGTRMNKKIPKPVVKVYGRPIISWIIDGFVKNNFDVAIIINPINKKYFNKYKNKVDFIYQENQKGTGHAVMKATTKIKFYKHVFVFVGDSPFVDEENILKMYCKHIDNDIDVTILSSTFNEKKFPYARIIRDSNQRIIKIIEEIDANNKEKNIKELFCSHYLFKSKILIKYLKNIKENPKTKEIYLTDILNELIADNKKISSLNINDWKKLVGLNTKEDLEWIESQKMI